MLTCRRPARSESAIRRTRSVPDSGLAKHSLGEPVSDPATMFTGTPKNREPEETATNPNAGS